MKIIINKGSMVPIYEQIMDAIRKLIASGELSDGDPLPSVRVLSNELRISALTVKKAYDCLEKERLTRTVHGKGTFVSRINPDLVAEQQRREIEEEVEKVISRAKGYGLDKNEFLMILDLLWEEY